MMYKYEANVGLNFGKLSPVIKWCERNCSGEWTVAFHNELANTTEENLYTFCFDTEEDYVKFLIWKK